MIIQYTLQCNNFADIYISRCYSQVIWHLIPLESVVWPKMVERKKRWISKRTFYKRCEYLNTRYIHYDPLMMSQKEAPRKHPWVLPRKVAKMVWILFHLPLYVEFDGCFLGASYYALAAAEGSTQEALIISLLITGTAQKLHRQVL